MKMKKLTVIAVAAALSIGSVMTSSAAWVQDGSSWRYQNNNGTYQAGTWFQDGGVWYHFDPMGVMQTGWFKDTNGKWYFFNYNGAMQTGLIMVNNNVYFMNPGGDLFVGEKVINGVSYNFTENGTTNGKPSVSPAMTFGSNGNQTLNYGHAYGGGSSSSGSSSSGGGSGSTSSVTVSTQEELNDALKTGKTSVKLQTDDPGKIIIESGTYNNTTLTVNAPNATIENHAKFAAINIEEVAENTWVEMVINNILNLYGNVHVNNQSGGAISVAVVKEKIQVRLDGGKINLNVNKAGSTVTSTAPIAVTVTKSVTLAVSESAAAESKVHITEKSAVEIVGTDGGSQSIDVTVEAAGVSLATALPTNIMVSTTSKVAVTLTSETAAKNTTMEASNAECNTALQESAKDIVNNTSVKADVDVTLSDGTKDPVSPDGNLNTAQALDQKVSNSIVGVKAQPFVSDVTKDGTKLTVKVKGVSTLTEAQRAAEDIFYVFDIAGADSIVGKVTINGRDADDPSAFVEIARELGLAGSDTMENVPGKMTSKTIPVEFFDVDGNSIAIYNVTVTK